MIKTKDQKISELNSKIDRLKNENEIEFWKNATTHNDYVKAIGMNETLKETLKKLNDKSFKIKTKHEGRLLRYNQFCVSKGLQEPFSDDSGESSEDE